MMFKRVRIHMNRNMSRDARCTTLPVAHSTNRWALVTCKACLKRRPPVGKKGAVGGG